MRHALALAATLILVGCGGGWTDAERAQFAGECEQAARSFNGSGTMPWDFDPAEYCRCAADELEGQLTAAEARGFPYGRAATETAKTRFAAADRVCLGY